MKTLIEHQQGILRELQMLQEKGSLADQFLQIN
jgi:hypothetical protein